MKILVLVSSPNSTLESVRTDGKKKMRAILGQDKELLFCEYSTIEIQRDEELFITCLRETIDKPEYFWPVLSAKD